MIYWFVVNQKQNEIIMTSRWDQGYLFVYLFFNNPKCQNNEIWTEHGVGSTKARGFKTISTLASYNNTFPICLDKGRTISGFHPDEPPA